MTAACKLDGSSLNGLNLRVAPRKEKAPQVPPNLFRFFIPRGSLAYKVQSYMGIGQVDGEQLLDLDMKKFRQEKQEVCNSATLAVPLLTILFVLKQG